MLLRSSSHSISQVHEHYTLELDRSHTNKLIQTYLTEHLGLGLQFLICPLVQANEARFFGLTN